MADAAAPDPRSDRPTLLVADLERIPDLLRSASAPVGARAALTVVTALAGVARQPRRVTFVGLGSSRFAALVLAPWLRDAKLDVHVEHASAARPATVHPGDLVVGISASGRTPETVSAIRHARVAGAATIAITNDPGSDLAQAADATLPLGAGTEASGVASVTFAATIATLADLAAALGAHIDPPSVRRAAADTTDALLTTRFAWLGPTADVLAGGRPVHVLADAADHGTAEQAALMLREGPRLEATAFDAGDWLHVGIYTALPGFRAILLSGTAYDAELARTIDGRSGRLVALGRQVEGAAAEIPAGDADPVARSIVGSVAVALLAAELWRR